MVPWSHYNFFFNFSVVTHIVCGITQFTCILVGLNIFLAIYKYIHDKSVTNAG